MDVTQRLFRDIKAVCPALRISIGTTGVSASVRIGFDPSATPTQKTNAQGVVDAFDWSQAAQDASDNLDARTVAVANLANPEAENKLLRALALVLLDEVNALRAAVVPSLPARTIAQVRTAIQGKINAGTADN